MFPNNFGAKPLKQPDVPSTFLIWDAEKKQNVEPQ